MALSIVQKFKIVSLASEGLSISQIALWKPFQFFLLGKMMTKVVCPQ
jgi:hypothetical protein